MNEEKFNQLCSDVEVIKEKVINYTDAIKDHEKRLRFLEKYAWMMFGGIGLVSIIINWAIK